MNGLLRLEAILEGALVPARRREVPAEMLAQARAALLRGARSVRGQRLFPSTLRIRLGPEAAAQLGSLREALERDLPGELASFAADEGANWSEPLRIRWESGAPGSGVAVAAAWGDRFGDEEPEELATDPTAGLPRLRLPSGELRAVTAPVVLGRGVGCDVRLFQAGVSARHARVWAAGGRLWIEDLGSRNGTWLRGRRVVAATPWSVGDVALLGGAALRLVAGRSG